jgi:hypothetical protein
MKKIPQTIYRWLGLLLITLLASCENVNPSVLITSAAQSPAGTPLTLQPTPLSKAFVCPITIGNGSAPPGVSDWPPGPTSHGNGALWTEFWPNNTVFAGPGYVRSDGDIDMKWP